MEKKRPHYALSTVRTLIEQGNARTTAVAARDAANLGFDFRGVLEIVAALKTADFYKSMTTYNDHRVWQDVYRPLTEAGRVYLKLTVIADLLIVSFKEL